MNSTTPLERRHFLRSTTAAALGVLGPTGSCLSAAQPVQKASPVESLVKVLHDLSLSNLEAPKLMNHIEV